MYLHKYSQFVDWLFLPFKGNFREDNFQQAMSKLGAGAREAAGRGKKGGQRGSNCFKVVKMIMERGLQPVIVFSFSRRDCEAYALQMSKLDFNTCKAVQNTCTFTCTCIMLMVVTVPSDCW